MDRPCHPWLATRLPSLCLGLKQAPGLDASALFQFGFVTISVVVMTCALHLPVELPLCAPQAALWLVLLRGARRLPPCRRQLRGPRAPYHRLAGVQRAVRMLTPKQRQ